jgi:hypothetical protein
MQSENAAAAKAVAVNAVPAAELLWRDAEILSDRLNCIPGTNVITRNPASVSRRVALRVFSGGDRDQ